MAALSDAEKAQDALTDTVFGLGYGGECFLSRYFSFVADAQANLSISFEKSVRFNNPGGVIFNLATLATISVYFN